MPELANWLKGQIQDCDQVIEQMQKDVQAEEVRAAHQRRPSRVMATLNKIEWWKGRKSTLQQIQEQFVS